MEDANLQLMYLGGISMMASVILCIILQQWTLPSTTTHWLLLLLTGNRLCTVYAASATLSTAVSGAGCTAYGSQMSQTIALKMVEASLATAMSYLSVVWGMLTGYFIFTEVCSA